MPEPINPFRSPPEPGSQIDPNSTQIAGAGTTQRIRFLSIYAASKMISVAFPYDWVRVHFPRNPIYSVVLAASPWVLFNWLFGLHQDFDPRPLQYVHHEFAAPSLRPLAFFLVKLFVARVALIACSIIIWNVLSKWLGHPLISISASFRNLNFGVFLGGFLSSATLAVFYLLRVHAPALDPLNFWHDVRNPDSIGAGAFIVHSLVIAMICFSYLLPEVSLILSPTADGSRLHNFTYAFGFLSLFPFVAMASLPIYAWVGFGRMVVNSS